MMQAFQQHARTALSQTSSPRGEGKVERLVLGERVVGDNTVGTITLDIDWRDSKVVVALLQDAVTTFALDCLVGAVHLPDCRYTKTASECELA